MSKRFVNEVFPMQPQLMLKDGTVISLSDDVYVLILEVIQMYEPEQVEPAPSFEALEAEFASLFEGDGPSTADLLEEHRREVARESARE